MLSFNCQDFREGCCGCCVNMNWTRGRLERYLAANTDVYERMKERRSSSLRVSDLILIHLLRGGVYDYLLAFILVPITLGLSAFLWKRLFGSCCFAGFINVKRDRVGCLIYPFDADDECGDLRRHAFPCIPTLKCDRALICPMLRDSGRELDAGWYEISQTGARSLAVCRSENCK